MKKEKKDLFTKREILTILNNAVIYSLSPSSGKIPEKRLRKLRAYAQALAALPLKHLNDKVLTPEELVAILAVSAMWVHCSKVMENSKIPAITEGVLNTVNEEN